MTSLADALQDCLAAVAEGRANIDGCPARYPDLAGELEPLLQVCERLHKALQVEPCPLYAQAARERFLAILASHTAPATPARRRYARSRPPDVIPTEGEPSPATPASPTASTSEG